MSLVAFCSLEHSYLKDQLHSTILFKARILVSYVHTVKYTHYSSSARLSPFLSVDQFVTVLICPQDWFDLKAWLLGFDVTSWCMCTHVSCTCSRASTPHLDVSLQAEWWILFHSHPSLCWNAMCCFFSPLPRELEKKMLPSTSISAHRGRGILLHPPCLLPLNSADSGAVWGLLSIASACRKT